MLILNVVALQCANALRLVFDTAALHFQNTLSAFSEFLSFGQKLSD